MADTVTLPKVGEVKKTYLYGTGAAVAAFVGWRWWQAGQSSAAVDTTAVPADSSGTIGADIGSGAGGYYGTPSAASDTTVDTTTVTTNAQWFQAAVDYLEGVGIDRNTASTALGLYLDHKALTTTQQGYVRTALGSMGNPPTGTYTLIEAPDTSPSALTAPKNVKVTPKDASTLTVSWDAVAGASSYQLFRDSVKENVGTSTDRVQTVGGLTPGSTHTVYVAAANASGKIGPKSTGVKAKTTSPKLSAPKKPVPRGVTRTSLTLTWGAVPGADRYEVYRNGHAIASLQSTALPQSDLHPNTTYTYQVVTVAPGGTKSPKSPTATAKTKK